MIQLDGRVTRSTVTYGKETIEYELYYAARKTMEIAVHPDYRVIVKAPIGTDYKEIQIRVQKRAGWIKKKLDYFRQFDPRTPPRRYVGGETHLYLGRQYRLKISIGERNEVKLIGGYFQVKVRKSNSPERVKRLLDAWYAEKASKRFKESFERCWPTFEKMAVTKPRLQIRRMKRRWGSLSSRGTVTLNTDLIRAPRECIDYVITHELCHLQYPNHGPEFYNLLERVMPDWEKRKRKLELALV